MDREGGFICVYLSGLCYERVGYCISFCYYMVEGGTYKSYKKKSKSKVYVNILKEPVTVIWVESEVNQGEVWTGSRLGRKATLSLVASSVRNKPAQDTLPGRRLGGRSEWWRSKKGTSQGKPSGQISATGGFVSKCHWGSVWQAYLPAKQDCLLG